MLAPRKTLWSTPAAVIPYLQSWARSKWRAKQTIGASSIVQDAALTVLTVCDVGCGDGRILLQWAKSLEQEEKEGTDDDDDDKSGETTLRIEIRFIGIEIDPQRASQAKDLCQDCANIEIHCCNALDAQHLLNDADMIFLYLIPRGLSIFQPILLEIAKQRAKKQKNCTTLEIMSYMSPLPNNSPCTSCTVELIERQLIRVEHQPGAEWPLYRYQILVNK